MKNTACKIIVTMTLLLFGKVVNSYSLEDVFFADPLDCGKYYLCVAGIPISLECPPGLHWNDRIKSCDWPASAGCDLVTEE